MKKILLATAAVALTAGAASADGVSLSGYGRFGVVYNNNSANATKTNVTSRFRLNIAATKTTDSGVEFGAKFRMQHDQGSIVGTSRSLSMVTNAATFWAKSGPFTLQVGNVSSAIDASGTYYAGDLGLLGWGDQEVLGYGNSFSVYTTGPWGATVPTATPTGSSRVGLLATYAANGLTVNLSYANPDQALASQTKETAISVDYTMGAFAFGAGYVHNGAFTTENNSSFISGQYSFGKSAVGLQVGDNGKGSTGTGTGPGGNADGTHWTIYGNTELANGIGLQGYVTKDDNPANGTGVGVGMTYDLGGAKLIGSIAKLRNKDTQADFGVKFTF